MCCVCVCWVHDTNRLLYLVLTENTTETERKLDETNGERTGLVSGNLEKEIVSHTKITHGFKDGHSEDNWRTLCVFVCVFRIEIDGYILEWMIFFFFFGRRRCCCVLLSYDIADIVADMHPSIATTSSTTLYLPTSFVI